jgi:hypothetical protein
LAGRASDQTVRQQKDQRARQSPSPNRRKSWPFRANSECVPEMLLSMLFPGFPFRAASTPLAVERTFLKDVGGFSLSSHPYAGSVVGARARARRDKTARTARPDHGASLEPRVSNLDDVIEAAAVSRC